MRLQVTSAPTTSDVVFREEHGVFATTTIVREGNTFVLTTTFAAVVPAYTTRPYRTTSKREAVYFAQRRVATMRHA